MKKTIRNFSIICSIIFLSLIFSFAVFTIDSSAASKIKVFNVTSSIADKVDNSLMHSAETSIMIKGSKSSASKKLSLLQKEIKKQNKVGVIFQHSSGFKNGEYYTFSVSKENARLYYYSVKFFKKLEKKYKTNMKEEGSVPNSIYDMKKYPNLNTRKLRLLYDYLVSYYMSSLAHYELKNGEYIRNKNYSTYTAHNYEMPATKGACSFENIYNKDYSKYVIKDVKERELETKISPDKFSVDVYTDYYFYSFKEFCSLAKKANLQKSAKFYFADAKEIKIYTRSFSELNGAMKLYAIAYSDFFGCSSYHDTLNMVYANTYKYYAGSKAMKIMYENKAKGVCSDFARYEQLAFTQLDITCYMNVSFLIDHAWSVVKVKNSKGKTLWVPFDYGIGPSEYLNVIKSQRKYINTEAKRYKLYLSGIKGAPNKKNFTWNDFI